MPKKVDEMMYILSPSRAYLAPVRVMGPIVHPLKTSRSNVVQMLLNGTEVHQYFPDTKETLKLTLTNIKDPDRYKKAFQNTPIKAESPVLPQYKEPITKVVKAENPVIPQFKETITKVVTPEKNETPEIKEETSTPAPEIKEEETPVTETKEEEIPTTEEKKFNLIEFEFNEDGTVNETNIPWSNFTKNQRREIRMEITKINDSIQKK